MYLSGGAISDPPIEQIPQSAYCATDPGAAPGDPLAGPAWNGWGNGSSNARFQSAEAAGMTAEDVPNLRLKWAFGFPGADSSGSQASVAGGRILIGSRTGLVYAIDAKSGCIHWIHEADAAVRSSPAVGPGPDGSFNVYFGDHAAYVYALDFATGDLRWKTLIGEHIDARITAAPVLHDGRLYVGLASGEEGTAVIPTYECCTFRGSTVALDAATGEQLWRRYVIAEEPTVRGRNAVGAPMWGPSGAGVWSTPTVDPARNTIYVATGDSYSNPPAPESDAIMALAADTGEVRWITQTTPGDAWNVACMSETEAAQTNCPENEGPDVDYAASTILTTAPDGREVVLAGQKSGMMYAMDPDTGDLLWETRVADGGILGGIEWGFAIDAAGAVYAATSDALEEEPGEAGGLTALSTANGEVVWYAPPVQDTCGSREGCHTAQPGAVSALRQLRLRRPIHSGERAAGVLGRRAVAGGAACGGAPTIQGELTVCSRKGLQWVDDHGRHPGVEESPQRASADGPARRGDTGHGSRRSRSRVASAFHCTSRRRVPRTRTSRACRQGAHRRAEPIRSLPLPGTVPAFGLRTETAR